MRPQDKVQFVKILTSLASVTGGKTTPEAIDLWFSAMQEWSIEEFSKAATHLLKTSKFMPKPADFYALRKAGEKTSAEAFEKALDYARGGWRDGPHPDNRIEQAVKGLGGWVVLAHSNEDKVHFLASKFSEHYETVCDKFDTREALPDLTTWKGRSLGAQPVGDALKRTLLNAPRKMPSEMTDEEFPF